MVHLELAVLGNWVMQCDDRGEQLFNVLNPVSEALIVVHEVEVVDPCGECSVSADAERTRPPKVPFRNCNTSTASGHDLISQ